GSARQRRRGGGSRRPRPRRSTGVAPAQPRRDRPRLGLAAGRRGPRGGGAGGLGGAARRVERRLLRAAGGRPRGRRGGALPRAARRGSRPERPHPGARGQGAGTRAPGDFQGSRCRARDRVPRMKEPVRTDAAPAPFQGAPYSQAIKANGLVFISGQLALKPGEKELVPGDIADQTEQAFANLRAILEAAGSSLDRIVKTTVFLQNLDDFGAMNEVYARHVG